MPTDNHFDDSIRRIYRAYDTRGRLQQVTSYQDTAATTASSEVYYDYDTTWGGVKTSWQEHSGQTSRSGPALSPKVDYAYADGLSGSAAKYVRLQSVTYPGGSTRRVVYYNYDRTGSDIDGLLSRVVDIADSTAAGRTKYADYAYLGAQTIVKVAHPAVTGD